MFPMSDEYGGVLLERWIAKSGLTRGDVAQELRVSRVSIWSWINHRSSPLEPVRKDIQRLTGGKVPVGSWGKSLDRRTKQRVAS